LARLDVELVRRGLARSRTHAVELIQAGRVRVGQRRAVKAAMPVPADALVTVERNAVEYVSRGGHKLAGALAAFEPRGLRVAGRRCLDAGASTGGFTDVLLRAGASTVIAVDVGHDQLAPSLRAHPAVELYERTHVRDLTVERIGGPVDVVVADLSFISLTHVLPTLRRLVVDDGDLVPLVKPQFEVGRDRLGRDGVVWDVALRAQAVRKVAHAAAELGLGVAGVVASPLPGPTGNREYFLWLRPGSAALDESELARVFAKETSP
jgi:23S rRNA (cytidine1920-2'-O)/16S rRNA (cytidine1409-2'-O)-methyltransferase